jgi:bile acid:Na+ symporter, BASS family
MRFIHLVFIIVLIHNGLALASGFGAATFFKLPGIDRRTVTIETGIQNSGLALVLDVQSKNLSHLNWTWVV